MSPEEEGKHEIFNFGGLFPKYHLFLAAIPMNILTSPWAECKTECQVNFELNGIGEEIECYEDALRD